MKPEPFTTRRNRVAQSGGKLPEMRLTRYAKKASTYMRCPVCPRLPIKCTKQAFSVSLTDRDP